MRDGWGANRLLDPVPKTVVLPNSPVFVAYNLFTLRAERVVYDVQSKTLQATGNVVTVDADGATRRADSMTLEIENGRVTGLN